jgi:hypothetical protein
MAQSVGADHLPMLVFEEVEEFRVRYRASLSESRSEQIAIHFFPSDNNGR